MVMKAYLFYELLFKQTSSIESKYTFDEAVEYMNLANKSEEDVVVANYKQLNEAQIMEKIKVEDKDMDFFSLRGAAIDDNYLYLPLTNNGAQKMIIAKYDLAANKVVKYSDVLVLGENSSWGKNPGNLFIVNDTIYVVKKDGLLALNKDLNSVENTLSIDFGKAAGNLLSIQYNEKLNKFAILDRSYNLYFAENGKKADLGY